MTNKYFYIGKQQALRNESFVYAVSDTPIENYSEIFGENCVEYIGDNLPYYVTIEENGKVREATRIELYKRGIIQLSGYEFIKDNQILSMYDYPIPEDIIKPVFDKEKLQWFESATTDEKLIYWKERCRNISSEMLVLEKAGLDGDADYMKLKSQLEESKTNYITASHELALEMDKVF